MRDKQLHYASNLMLAKRAHHIARISLSISIAFTARSSLQRATRQRYTTNTCPPDPQDTPRRHGPGSARPDRVRDQLPGADACARGAAGWVGGGGARAARHGGVRGGAGCPGRVRGDRGLRSARSARRAPTECDADVDALRTRRVRPHCGDNAARQRPGGYVPCARGISACHPCCRMCEGGVRVGKWQWEGRVQYIASLLREWFEDCGRC